MSSLIKTALHNSVAEGIYREFLTKTSRYYYFLGKTLNWDSMDTAEVPRDTFTYELETRNKIIFVKQINLSDVSFVVPRYDWVSGAVYDMYDDFISESNLSTNGFSKLEDSKFYVVTDQFNVYKCIFNNNGARSTVKPSGLDSTSQTYSDGYIWKFMYNIPIALRNKFLTTAVIPVSNALNNQFYSNGEINTVVIENGGSGYTTASLVVNGNGYQEENPYVISGATVINSGSGYTIAPTATISAPTITLGIEAQATATASLTDDSVSSITIDETGYGYEDNATITLSSPFPAATVFAQNNAESDGDIIEYNGNFYEVVGTGLTGSAFPTHTSGTVTNGTVDLTYVGTQATAILQLTKTNALLSPVISGGEIVGVTVDNPGVGYTYATITVVGDGTGAILTPDFSVGDVDTVQADIELQAIGGAIEAINVTNSGSGYGSATVTITGDGTGATAVADVNQGKIRKILMTNTGSNYTWATISITGNGTLATARAIISPYGGHGKNAINELFAKTLVFYTTISSDKNQGLVVTNDYRQTGIIKRIANFDSEVKYTKTSGSACFKVSTTTIDIADYPKDSIIYNKSTNKSYYVVESYDNVMLIQPVENETPVKGDVFRNSDNGEFTLTEVVAPSIDKFSGDMLFIDNRPGFTPSPEQSIIFRTVIGF